MGNRAFLCLLVLSIRGNQMSSKHDKSETHLSEDTIQRLQKMRRANAAIIGCIEILNEHDINSGSIPGGARVFIRLDPQQQMGLAFAIEACAREIAREFDGHLEDLGVYWSNEICSDVNTEAQAVDDLHNKRISFAEFEERIRPH